MRIIVPCAGKGTRFKVAGWVAEKPLLPIAGVPMIEWALSCVPERSTLHIVTRRDQADVRAHALWQRYVHHHHVVADHTQGAALSILAAAVGLPPDEPVAVMNADQWFVADVAAAEQTAQQAGWAGFILTFPGDGPQWSYAVVDEHGFVVRVLEKLQVGRHATVGFYWWARAWDLVEATCRMVAAGDRTRGEFYAAPTYNYLVNRLSNLVKAIPTQRFFGLGTPEQVRVFEGAVRRGEVLAPLRV